MNRKNGFFAFCFACVPGCGQMYLGYLKRGLSIAGIFWGVIALSYLFHLNVILFALPVIWFFAFFDTFSIRNQTPDAFCSNPDDYIFHAKQINLPQFMSTKHHIIGIGLIVLGAYIIFDNVIMNFMRYFHINSYIYQIIYSFLQTLPSIGLALLLVWLGVRLTKGTSNTNEDFTNYTPNTNFVEPTINESEEILPVEEMHDDTDETK